MPVMCKAHPILTTCDLQHQVERAEDLGLFDEPDDKFICGICKENLSDGEKVCTLATSSMFCDPVSSLHRSCVQPASCSGMIC